MRLLGAGMFGKVFLSASKHHEHFLVAIKVLEKDKLPSSYEVIKQEVKILHSLDHPNIVKYFETY